MVKTCFRILFVSFMLTGFVAFPCWAKYGGGTGTAQQPYLIYTAAEMNEIGLYSVDWDKDFALMADIDLGDYTGAQFNLIGESTSKAFSGVFDGRGHVISGFTYTGEFGEQIVGLFRVVGDGGVVKNLGLSDPNVSGFVQVGALVAKLDAGTIENCWVTGGKTTADAEQAGALVGYILNGTVLNCYASNVSVNFFSKIGGLAGGNEGGFVVNSYAANVVFGLGIDVGAFVGDDVNGFYTDCFYDEQVNPLLTGTGDGNDPCGLTGESTASLQQGATFINADWDIVTSDNQPLRNIWRMCEDDIDYPRLAVEYLSADFACPDGIDIFDLAVFSDQWVAELLSTEVDFDLNRRVDFRDWAILAAAWRGSEGSGNYNAIVDVYPAGGDGVVDEMDVVLFVESWLGYGLAYLNADIEPYGGDGVVDFADFAAFANQWFEE